MTAGKRPTPARTRPFPDTTSGVNPNRDSDFTAPSTDVRAADAELAAATEAVAE